MGKEKKILIITIIVLTLVFACILAFYFKDTSDIDINNFNNFFDNQNSESDDFEITEESTKVEVKYSDEELQNEYTKYDTKVDLNKMSVDGDGVKVSNSKITIFKAGTYYFSGTAEDASIVVEANKEDIVVLVFDGSNITSKTTSVINGIKAKEIIINLAKNSKNIFTDAKEYTDFTDEDEPDSLIFSKTDLTINGDGNLTLNANYEDGIASKDTLKIINANIEITANDDAVRGKDAVVLKDATITIVSKEDAIKSTNEENGKGYIVVDGGTYNIEAGDDGISAEVSLFINSGNINISKSKEGLEAQYMEINGGKINIVSSDDGINVNGGSDNMFMRPDSQNTNQDPYRLLVINGGEIFVNASGDGLDSNGSIKMTGGTVIVSGPTNSGNGAMDYNYTFELTGGNIIYYGAEGMWQDASSSSIYTVSFSVQNGKQGDKIVLKDENGNEVESIIAEKTYQRISFASEKIEKGKKYTLYVNNENVGELDVEDFVTTNSTNKQMDFGGGRKR